MRNPARRIQKQGHKPRIDDERLRQEDEEYVKEKQSLERDLEKAKMELAKQQVTAQIEMVKKGVPGSVIQMQTDLDIQAESLKKFLDGRTAISETARRQKALNAEMFKNNPTERRKRDLMVDEWARIQLEKIA